MSDGDGFECDPNIEECGLPEASSFAAAHFFLWFLTWINSAGPITYWFVWLKKEIDDDSANKAILERNWWWMDTAWPMVVWGHIGLYGVPAFFGIFTWFGVKFFDGLYKFWMTGMVNYVGTIMHFLAMLAFFAGAGFWIEQDLISRTRAWITGGAYAGWTVISFIWMAYTVDDSNMYMYLKHCDDECYVEVEAEEDEAEEIPDDATTFAHDSWVF